MAKFIVLLFFHRFLKALVAFELKLGPSIGVVAYTLQSKLPGGLKGLLPTAKQLADIVRCKMEGGK